jgi:Cu2+-exporting ATPase
MQRSFRVEGMSCTACAASVESILLSLKGVAVARVNLNEATVWIDYKPDQVTLAEMKEALEKVGYSLHEDLLLNLEEEEQHFRLLQSRLRNRVIIAFVFAVPVFVLSMFFHHRQEWYLWQAVLTLPVLWAGWNMIVPGFRRLIAGHSTMDSLVALGTTAAYIFSLSQMVLAKMGMLAGGAFIFILSRQP